MGLYIDKHFGAIGGFSTRNKANEFVKAQLNKKYDMGDIVQDGIIEAVSWWQGIGTWISKNILSKINPFNDPNSWDCSELCSTGERTAGLNVCPDKIASDITPTDEANDPLLIKDVQTMPGA